MRTRVRPPVETRQVAWRLLRGAKDSDCGFDDPIATTGLEGQVAAKMRRTGFTRVRLERFMGTHQLKRSELKLALRWFRELGGF